MEGNKKPIKQLTNNNIQNVLKKEIKREKCDENKDLDIQIKVEHSEFDEESKFKKELLDADYEVREELYLDHVIKDEMVIGPEVIQEVNLTNVKKETKSELNRNEMKKEFIDKCETQKEKNIEKNKGYVCDYCEKSFDNNIKLQRHMKQGHKSHKCRKCGEVFSFSSNLARHLKIHTGVKSYQCSQCDKSFARNDYLKFHIQRHHLNIVPVVAPVTCELCNKEFAKKCSRDHHKKYSCPMNKSKIKLKRNKLYSCDACDKSYIYRTSLSAHIMRRHMKRVIQFHECDHCGVKYVKKHNLQCHMQVKHLNVYPYECKKCNETFKWHSTLSSHIKKMHKPIRKRNSKQKKIVNFVTVKLEPFDSGLEVKEENLI